MDRLEGQRISFAYDNAQHSYARLQQAISTVALLVLGYYLLSLIDAWPSTTKRTLYTLSIRLIPSRFIYLLQHVMMRLGRLPDRDLPFRRQDFGNFQAKEEALQQLVHRSHIPNVLQRARTLSGYDKILPTNKETGPPGLGNWDNSCYQNSVLQGLASLSAFQDYMHRSRLLCEKTGVTGHTTGALMKFLEQLADTSSPKQTIWTPKVLKSMDSWQQQDAQEYFSRMLEAVEKEAVLYTKVVARSTGSGLTCLLGKDPSPGADREKAARKMLQTLVANPMDGMFAQALTCQTCGFSEGVSLTQFNCLTVNLGLGGQRSIESLLDEYTQPELIEGVECDNCTRAANKADLPTEDEFTDQDEDKGDKKIRKKELRVKAKQITFGRLPKDLVVHVNRSIWDDYGNQIKNPSFVQFPLRLDFSNEWCTPLEAEAKAKLDASLPSAVYELQCIVTHSGRHDNGHYVAYGKRDKDWYCFNDEIVTKLSEAQVLTRGNVFMLFYEAVDAVDLDTADDAPNEAEIVAPVQGTESESVTSAESETYDDFAAEQTSIPVPVLRTAGGVHPAEPRDAIGMPVVPAV